MHCNTPGWEKGKPAGQGLIRGRTRRQVESSKPSLVPGPAKARLDYWDWKQSEKKTPELFFQDFRDAAYLAGGVLLEGCFLKGELGQNQPHIHLASAQEEVGM